MPGDVVAAAAEAGAGGDHEVDRLIRVEPLLVGPLLAEWPSEDWALRARDEVEEAADRVLERLAAALVERGRPDEAAPRLRRLVRRSPEARERLSEEDHA